MPAVQRATRLSALKSFIGDQTWTGHERAGIHDGTVPLVEGVATEPTVCRVCTVFIAHRQFTAFLVVDGSAFADDFGYLIHISCALTLCLGQHAG
jgi:hypothetical protein